MNPSRQHPAPRRTRSSRPLLRTVAVTVLVAAGLLTTPTTSWADPAGYATYDDLAGSSTDFTTAMRMPAAGFPIADVTTTSRSGGVGRQSGDSAWLGAGTPVGAVYGSSQGQPYINLRPRADTPNGTSITTYMFRHATPSAGWAFALGDIDADQVRVQASAPDGSPVAIADLGFQGTFNYCNVSPKPSSCKAGQGSDLPTWDPATGILVGNPAATDTDGASGWFEPSVPLGSLTLEFTRRSGFPIYQTWFTAQVFDVAGSVRLDNGPAVSGAEVELRDSDGHVLARTTTAADGSYEFPGYTASDGYTAHLVVPEGHVAVGPKNRPVDLRQGDQTDVDFVVHQLQPVTVGGTVTADGQPVAGVEVQITGDGVSFTTTTDASGAYAFPDIPQGEYSVEITVPDGFSADQTRRHVVIPPHSDDDVTGVDFTLDAIPEPTTATGTITDQDGEPIPGVEILVEDSDGGRVDSDVTDGQGEFELSIPPGEDYVATVVPPDGFEAEPSQIVFDADEGGTLDLAFTLVPTTPATTPPPTAAAPTSPPVGNVPPGGTVLPDTGGPPWGISLVGLALLLAGVVGMMRLLRPRPSNDRPSR